MGSDPADLERLHSTNRQSMRDNQYDLTAHLRNLLAQIRIMQQILGNKALKQDYGCKRFVFQHLEAHQ